MRLNQKGNVENTERRDSTIKIKIEIVLVM